MSAFDFDQPTDIAWCPGCGNFGILKSLKKAIEDLSLPADKLVMVSGIGQAAKTPQYFKCNFFNGLHGRALPAATAIKAVRPETVVIAEGGDGDMYGEGGNHFMHTIRRNPDITHIVHNNMVYGLTKGQASPTSERGFKTPIQVSGVHNQPMNPLAVAISLNATFVARVFTGDEEKMTEVITKAITHKGYALVDIFQPCVSFNKVNNFQWYKDNTYDLPDNYDPSNQIGAMQKALEADPYPLGVLYEAKSEHIFEQMLDVYKEDKSSIICRKVDRQNIINLLEATR